MTAPAARVCLAAMCCLVAAGLLAGSAAAQQTESVDVLKKKVEDLIALGKAGDDAGLAAALKDLPIPGYEAYFKKLFGDELGAKVSDEYAGLLPKLEPELVKTFKRLGSEGLSNVAVYKIVDGMPNEQATGLQQAALRAMKEKTALYLVRAAKPGKTVGTTMWSWVWVDGGFRLAGRMNAVKGG